MKAIALTAITAALITTIINPAQAQPQNQEKGWNISVGAGLMTTPSYIGDNEYQILMVPNIRVAYEDKFFASIQEGIGYNVVNTQNWRIGPIIRPDFGRDSEGTSPFRIDGGEAEDLIGLREIDTTAELGAFIEYKMRPLTFNLELRQAAGGHEGLVGNTAITYGGRTRLMNKHVIYNFGPEMRFADADYHDAYFGVNATESAASGLSQYEGDAGILSYGIGGSLIMPLTDHISTIFFTNYARLGNEAADSSLVEERGTENQLTTGLFLNYTF